MCGGVDSRSGGLTRVSTSDFERNRFDGDLIDARELIFEQGDILFQLLAVIPEIMKKS